jgi:hypothetical protein
MIVDAANGKRFSQPKQGTIRQFSLSLGSSLAALLLDWRLDAGHLTLGNQPQTDTIFASFHFVFLVLAAVSVANS